MDIEREIDERCTPGFGWGMFTSAGNVAAANAYAAIARDPALTRETLLARIGDALDALDAVYPGSWDSVVQEQFQIGAALICEREQWDTRFTRFDFPSPVREARQRAAEDKKRQRDEATRLLIERHGAEFNELLAQIQKR